ncbi:MAG: hypothetical protein DRJ03_08605 [Chloroflexi bacterium]|nr:MAG: hypothetical protein DRJ03_08605 [Chloroflexota bacterium]
MQDVTASLPIAELGLDTRTRNVLIGAGFSTVGDVLAAIEEEGDNALTNIKGFGPKSLTDLKGRLEEHGFHLPDAAEAGAPRVAKALEEEAMLAATLLAEDADIALEAALEEKSPEPAAPIAAEEPKAAAPVAAPPAPKVESLDEPLSFSQRLRATFAHLRRQPGSGAWVYGMIGLLVIVALMLPPISLLRRLGIVGYTTISAENNSASHPDGLTISVDAETFDDKLRVRLDSAPREVFLMGDAGSALKKAVEALPAYLEVKSPLYQIQTRGNVEQPVTIDVLMPNGAEPWETLDLYTWSGESWEWVGSDLHTEMAEHEHISAHVTDVPDNIVVVQVGTVTQTVSTFLEPGDNPAAAAGMLDEINPTGLLLGLEGGFVGDPTGLLQPVEGDAYDVLPTLRNWAPGAAVNHGLLSDLLTVPEIQKAHIAHIVQLCTESGFAGADVDYRGVEFNERDAYSDFIGALADALHAEGLRLTVVVESAAPTNGGWDTGGYDCAALGAAADAVKVPFPDDPAAYVETGAAQRLLDWATAQVSRRKLRMLVSSLSAERSSAGIDHISLEQALAPFGEIVALSNVAQVEPGSQVMFGFSGQLLSITPQENAGAYRLEYEVGDGEIHSVWLGTASSLALKLNWARRYHLGGVAVADVLAAGNAAGIADAVTGYRNGIASPAGQEMNIVWTISNAEAGVGQQSSPLTEPDYVWTVAVATGTYTVSAAIAGFDHGAVPVSVGAPEPEVTEVVTATGDLDASAPAAAASAVTDECLDASYVADVTIPDNTQLDNGEGFVKTWRVRNTGTCDWPEDTVIAFSEGSQMGAPANVAVGALEPGAETEVSVDMEAPADAGRYSGIWRMQTAGGFFGGNLSVVILAGEVTAPPVTAVAPVSGGSFELGGHVRDTAFPYADKMHYAGMNWAKVQVHYGQDVSGLVAASHAQGFKIQLSALGSPDMVTKGGFEQDFANWVAGLAAAGADAIEVWNEPNIDREWAIGHISPQAYTNLLCASYNAIKAANAGTAVISAAPAPTGWFGGCGPDGCDDAPWMAGMRDAGAANCMDYIGAHHNSGATSPSARIGHPANPGDTHHSWFFLPQTEMYYNTFGGARKLFYTEMGYASQEGLSTFSDQFAWARGTNNAQQAAWLAEAVQLSVNTGMVRCIIVWNIDFVRYGYDPQDGYAIIRPGGACPACDSLHNVLGTR